MADVTISGDELTVTLRGIRKLGTIKSELTIPLANVRGASVDPGLSLSWAGLRKNAQWPGRKVRGTNLYGTYLGGVFVQDGDRVFWDVADPDQAIVITLTDDDFTRLYLEVDHPEETVRAVESALAERH